MGKIVEKDAERYIISEDVDINNIDTDKLTAVDESFNDIQQAKNNLASFIAENKKKNQNNEPNEQVKKTFPKIVFFLKITDGETSQLEGGYFCDLLHVTSTKNILKFVVRMETHDILRLMWCIDFQIKKVDYSVSNETYNKTPSGLYKLEKIITKDLTDDFCECVIIFKRPEK